MNRTLTRRRLVTGAVALGFGSAALSRTALAQESTPNASPAASPAASPIAGTTRTVEHARGTAKIPTNPQRVVALGEEFLLADLLTLGVSVIASTATVQSAGFAGLDGFDTSAIEVLDGTEPDLERLVALAPDLLITYTYVWEAVGDDVLNGIAPTVVVGDEADWRAGFLALGALLAKEDAAEQALVAYDEAVAGAQGTLAPAGRPVSIATIYPESSLAVWVDGPTNIPQTVLDLGFTLDPGPGDIPDAENGRAFLSIEQLGLLRGEALLMLQSAAVEGEQASFDEVLNRPLWQTLPAVQADQVTILDRLGYPGVAGRQRLVADLTTALG